MGSWWHDLEPCGSVVYYGAAWPSLCELKWWVTIVKVKACDLNAPISQVKPLVPYMLMKETGNRKAERRFVPCDRVWKNSKEKDLVVLS